MKKALIITLIVLFLLLSYLTLRKETATGSTFKANPQGARAFYQLLVEEGYDVSQHRRPLAQLEGELTQTTLFLIGSLNDFSLAPVFELVKNGLNVVIMSEVLLAAGNIPEVRLAPTELLWHEFRFEPEETMRVDCVGESRVCAGVKQISLIPPLKIDSDSTAKALLRSSRDVYAVTTQMGSGTVWIFSSSKLVQNQHVDLADNARLLFQLASQRPSIVFNEFHHGYIEPPEGADRKKLESLILACVVFATFLILITLSRSLRFGPPVVESNDSGSSTAEFIVALGQLYSCHRDSQAVLKHYLAGWKKRLQEQFGLSYHLSYAGIVDELIAKGIIATTHREPILSGISELEQANQPNDHQEIIELLESVFAWGKYEPSRQPSH